MRTNHPITPAPGTSVQEVLTPGFKTRYQAETGQGKGPLRKSYNSAAADTQRRASQ